MRDMYIEKGVSISWNTTSTIIDDLHNIFADKIKSHSIIYRDGEKKPFMKYPFISITPTKFYKRNIAFGKFLEFFKIEHKVVDILVKVFIDYDTYDNDEKYLSIIGDVNNILMNYGFENMKATITSSYKVKTIGNIVQEYKFVLSKYAKYMRYVWINLEIKTVKGE